MGWKIILINVVYICLRYSKRPIVDKINRSKDVWPKTSLKRLKVCYVKLNTHPKLNVVRMATFNRFSCYVFW